MDNSLHKKSKTGDVRMIRSRPQTSGKKHQNDHNKGPFGTQKTLPRPPHSMVRQLERATRRRRIKPAIYGPDKWASTVVNTSVLYLPCGVQSVWDQGMLCTYIYSKQSNQVALYVQIFNFGSFWNVYEHMLYSLFNFFEVTRTDKKK